MRSARIADSLAHVREYLDDEVEGVKLDLSKLEVVVRDVERLRFLEQLAQACDDAGVLEDAGDEAWELHMMLKYGLCPNGRMALIG